MISKAHKDKKYNHKMIIYYQKKFNDLKLAKELNEDI